MAIAGACLCGAPASASGAPLELFSQPACIGATTHATVFKSVGPPLVDWLENLGFDGRGGMWVSEEFAGKVVRFSATGAETASIPLAFPGAVVKARDGEMYAVGGDSPFDNVTNGGGVVRFDPISSTPALTTVAEHLQMTNGATFDAAGNLYLTDGSNIARITAAGTLDTKWGPGQNVSGNDGLLVVGNQLYATILTSFQTEIVRISLTTGQRTIFVELSGGATGPLIPKLPDDLTLGPDGRIYLATALGDLFRIDPSTGVACQLYSGPALTSARFAAGFPPYTGNDLFLTSEQGQIVELNLGRLPAPRRSSREEPIR